MENLKLTLITLKVKTKFQWSWNYLKDYLLTVKFERFFCQAQVQLSTPILGTFLKSSEIISLSNFEFFLFTKTTHPPKVII